jgi:hypothetical protein
MSEEPKVANDVAYVLQRNIQEAIQTRIAEVKEQIVREAVREFEKEVRGLISSVAVNVADYYSIQRLANELVIHVKIEGHLEAEDGK